MPSPERTCEPTVAGCMGEALGALGVPIGQLRVSTVKVSLVAMSGLLDGIHEVVSRIHVL